MRRRKPVYARLHGSPLGLPAAPAPDHFDKSPTANQRIARVEPHGEDILVHRRLREKFGSSKIDSRLVWEERQCDMADFVRWTTPLFEKVLVPLHHRYPIDRVRIDFDHWPVRE